MGEFGWIPAIILGMFPMPVIGQLIARILYFNGSLDKSWLFLFSFPMMNLGVLAAIKLGWLSLKDGEGPVVYDTMMFIPMISKFVVPLIISFIYGRVNEIKFNDVDPNTGLISILSYFIQFICVYVVQLIRMNGTCKLFRFDASCNKIESQCNATDANCLKTECSSISGNMMGKCLIDATVIMAISDMLENVTPIVLKMIPALMPIIALIGRIPGLGNILDRIGKAGIWSSSYAVGYTLTNMFNQDNIKSYCTYTFLNSTFDNILFIGSIITIIFSQVLSKLTDESEGGAESE